MSENLTLRQVRESDRWTLWAWRNSERIRRVSMNDEEIARSSHDRWFTQRFPTMRDRTVVVEWNGVAVGWFQIEKWDTDSRHGEWGIALGAENTPAGLGKAMPLLVHSHAFARLGARQMTGRVLELNTKMLTIMRRLQFPTATIDENPIRRTDGSTSRVFVFQVQQTEWSEVLDAGRQIVPLSLKSAMERVMTAPLRE